jgi:hypothetical protein
MRKAPMRDTQANLMDLLEQRQCQRQAALARWENEGGAGPRDRHESLGSGELQSDVPPLTAVELVQLQIRVIALENLVIAVLAEASDRQLELVREMAAHISPRPGFTPHRLTLHAAAEMISLVDRATRFRVAPAR